MKLELIKRETIQLPEDYNFDLTASAYNFSWYYNGHELRIPFSLDGDIVCIVKKSREKLNEIERSAIIDYLKDRYVFEKMVFRNFEFFKHGKKIWIATKGIEHSLNLRVESIGLMFMRIEKNKIKLSTIFLFTI